MINSNFSILLCTNGDEHNRPALEYGVWLAEQLGKEALLLGFCEKPDRKEALNRLIAETVSSFEKAAVTYTVKIESGRGAYVIPRYANIGNYLTVVGRLGRSYWRRIIRGRSFRRLMEVLTTPILYVPKVRLPIKRVLICLGGLEYARDMEDVCLLIAKAARAEIQLLHVIEPVTLDYPQAREVQDHWKDILDTDTVVGRNLRRRVEAAQQTGLSVNFKVRQGNIFHEILSEARSDEYDLLGMGSAYSAHTLRHFYLPNITAEVAETLECPVLTARFHGESS